MNKYRAIIVQVDKLFGNCNYYAECVQAENEQDALKKAKQTETFRMDGTSVVVSIEKLKGAMNGR